MLREPESSDLNRYFVSINRELKPLLHVLRHEYKGIQGYTPTNIQGVHEIGPHLLAFTQKWRAEGCPPLLACTLDVERAFDTVNQDRCVNFAALALGTSPRNCVVLNRLSGCLK